MRLDAADVAAPAGRGWSQAWTARVDAAVRAWFDGHGATAGGLAVVALGGYARRELCPASDVDLLLLHDGWRPRDLEALVQALCYPLWDAGLSVGHAVRTPAEAVRAAAERVDGATALTERRLVAGSAGLLDDVASRLSRWLRRHRGRVLAELAEADAARHRRAGEEAGPLEPDLKDGAGGLRDLHSLRWAAAVLLGEVGLDPLVGARYLGADERRELAVAADDLLRARVALHLLQGRRRPGSSADRLRLDLQDDVARGAGFADGDALLRAVGLAQRTIGHVHGRTWPRLLADARGGRARRRPAPRPVGPGLAVVDGALEVDADRALADEPALGLRAVAAATAAGVPLARASEVRLRAQARAAGEGGLGWDEDTRRALLSVLCAGPAAVGALADADHLGLLVAHLPGWGRLRALPQRNPLHRLPVDLHLHRTVAELGAVASGARGDHPAEVYGRLGDPEVLLLAGWLHDVGKGLPGDHSETGAALAETWVAAMGFGAGRARAVADLVRAHLLLPDTAMGHDLDDEATLTRVAERVGDVATLDGLYLLSLADARATGPAACSAWKDELLATLHVRTRQLLLDDGGRGGAASAAAAVAAARERLGSDDALLDVLLDGVPRRYVLAAGAEQLVAHARLADRADGGVRAAVRPGDVEGTAVLSVVAADRRGLVASCAGALAAAGVEVLDARAFTRVDGVALDWFVVRDDGGVAGGFDWPAVADAVGRAARGALDVDEAVRRREARRGGRRVAPAAPVPVEVRLDAGPEAARLEVAAPDAPGLLYRLAAVLADAGIDVTGVRAATLGPAARDVFFVRPDDLERVRGLLPALVEAAGQPPGAGAR